MASQTTKTIRLWFELWRELPSHDRRKLGVAAFTMVLSSILTAVLPLIVGSFVDAVFAKGQMGTLEESLRPLVLLITTLLAISVMELWRHQLVHKVTTSFEATARQRLYQALMRWDLQHYIQGQQGTIYGRANRSIEGGQRLIKLGASDLLPAILVSVFAIALAIYKYDGIGLVMAIVVPTGLLIVWWQISSQKNIRVNVVRAKERIDGDVNNALDMLAVIRASGTEPYFDGRVRTEVADLRDRELRHHIAMSKFDMFKAVNEATWLIVTLVVILQSQAFGTAGDLAGAVMLYIAITRPLRDLHRIFDETSESAVQATHLVDDLQVPWDASYTTASGEGAFPVDGSIVARDLHFSYPTVDSEDERTVLNGLSLTIPAGQRIGIVGPTGCGKSTFLKLVARLEHNAAGELLVGGKPVEQIPRKELVHQLGYVAQEPRLFRGTVRDNLDMGRAFTDEQLLVACERANIDKMVRNLPAGLDTIVGERGATLSGGQRQRLCLARALVRTPPIMLLDEPTSALDPQAQATVQAAIDQLIGVTMVIVAHRLSTLKTLDRIVVFDKGVLAEDGTFEELAMIPNGIFANMLKEEELRPDHSRVASDFPVIDGGGEGDDELRNIEGPAADTLASDDPEGQLSWVGPQPRIG